MIGAAESKLGTPFEVLEQRATLGLSSRKAAARQFLESRRGIALLRTLAKGDILAAWNNERLAHLEALDLVTSNNLLMTNGRLSISKRWSITALGRDVAGEGA